MNRLFSMILIPSVLVLGGIAWLVNDGDVFGQQKELEDEWQKVGGIKEGYQLEIPNEWRVGDTTFFSKEPLGDPASQYRFFDNGSPWTEKGPKSSVSIEIYPFLTGETLISLAKKDDDLGLVYGLELEESKIKELTVNGYQGIQWKMEGSNVGLGGVIQEQLVLKDGVVYDLEAYANSAETFDEQKENFEKIFRSLSFESLQDSNPSEITNRPLEKRSVDTSSWTTVRSSGVGIEMFVPPTWEMDEDSNREMAASPIPGSSDLKQRLFWDPSKMLASGSQVTFGISSFILNDGESLESFVSKGKDEDLGEYSWISPLSDTTLGDASAIQYVINETRSSEPVVILEVLAKIGNQYYEIEAQADTWDLYHLHLPIFEAMIDSIKFINP